MHPRTAGRSVGFTNNIFQRCTLNFSTGTVPYIVSMFNNLFLYGSNTFAWTSSSYDFYQGIVIEDNLFAGKHFSYQPLTPFGYGPSNISYNAYYQTTALNGRFQSGGNVTITNLDFQPGALGNYYYPARNRRPIHID